MPYRPQIGITAASDVSVKACANAVRRAGGEPRSLAPSWLEPVEETLRPLDALFVYGEDLRSTDSFQDWASELISAAMGSDLAVLAVGGGIEVLNVAMGGRVAEVPGHALKSEGDEEMSSYHRIYIAPGSKLAAVVGSGGIVRVNSRHRVGIYEAQKSKCLMASAYSLEDGVIEALESPEHDWVIGVQFHPEIPLEIPPHFDRIFIGLMERARQRHAGSL